MRTFSQRKGLEPVKTVIQTDSIDIDLRNSLWNALTIYYWDTVKRNRYTGLNLLSDPQNRDMKVLLQQLWLDYFKSPLDTLNDWWSTTHPAIKQNFFGSDWNEVYDFVEFVANNHPDDSLNQRFMEYCNSVLELELSAYRFVGGMITQITAEEEISEIQEALQVPLRPVQEHLRCSLDLLADRKNPDYRNSIKESILAVEAICQLIADSPKATLPDALKEIEKKAKVALHPALKRAFDCLYGYTSDAEGIRHALLDEPNLHFEDAKFMLVSCSAFINYLIAKSSKAGIQF